MRVPAPATRIVGSWRAVGYSQNQPCTSVRVGGRGGLEAARSVNLPRPGASGAKRLVGLTAIRRGGEGCCVGGASPVFVSVCLLSLPARADEAGVALPGGDVSWDPAQIMSNSRERDKSESAEGSVPKAVVSRLSLYLRELQHLKRDGHETISSTYLGSRLGISDAQVRKDLAYFGQFGYPGIGYRCDELIRAIRAIMGTDRDWAVALVGVGNLGLALLRHRGFAHQGFRIVAAFDVSKEKVDCTLGGVPVYGVERIAEIVAAENIRLGIIAVPAEAAQEVAAWLVEAGVGGILNFAPVSISVPSHVSKSSVDLAIELEQLSFAVVNRAEST